MYRVVPKVLGAVLLLGVLVTLTAPGQAAEDPFKVEEGFTPLFNGKDLSGWVYKAMPKESLEGKTETPDKRFEVKDGVILVNEKDKEGKAGIKDLYTVKEYNKGFHLKLEFRAAPRADSGLYIRGPQLQVRDYPTVGPYKNLKSFKDGGWNELDVVVTNGVVTTTVNGKPLTAKDVLEVVVKDGKPVAKLNGQPIDINNLSVSVGAAALCKCNGEVLEQAFKAGNKGGIGLQAEVGKFEFRRIRIKELE
jgi:hypothetical protein